MVYAKARLELGLPMVLDARTRTGARLHLCG